MSHSEDDDTSGYELHLIGGLVESKTTLDKHLQLGWLDAKTRRLVVGFQLYTPATDSVTVVRVRMETCCGFLYMINTDVSKSFSRTISDVNTERFCSLKHQI